MTLNKILPLIRDTQIWTDHQREECQACMIRTLKDLSLHVMILLSNNCLSDLVRCTDNVIRTMYKLSQIITILGKCNNSILNSKLTWMKHVMRSLTSQTSMFPRWWTQMLHAWPTILVHRIRWTTIIYNHSNLRT